MRILALTLFALSASSCVEAQVEAELSASQTELLVLVGADGSPVVNGTPSDSLGLAAAVRSHIESVPGGYVRFGFAEGVQRYPDYVRWIDTIKGVYVNKREEYTAAEYGRPQAELTEPELEAVWQAVPLTIRLIEP